MDTETLEILEIEENGKSKTFSKQSIQLLKLCFTYNNYKNEDIEILERSFIEFKKIQKFVFQEEIAPTTGTPHLQGSVWFKTKTRWEELKLPFGNKMRWSSMRNEDACIKYCQKAETSKPGSTPHVFGFPKPLKLITPDKLWQIKILDIIKSEPDDRKVFWFWSEKGGVGKSQFCKYLLATSNCVFIDEGKKADIMYSIMEANMDDCNVVLFDIPRDNGNKISYKSIESIKNGVVYSPKYESKHKLFNSPHVICFANCLPEIEKMSDDRWVIEEIF